MSFRNLNPHICEDSSAAAVKHGTTKAPWALPGQRPSLEARGLHLSTPSPKRLEVWLSDSVQSPTANYRQQIYPALRGLLFFFFLFLSWQAPSTMISPSLWLLCHLPLSALLSQGERHKGGRAPRDLALQLCRSGAALGVMNLAERKGLLAGARILRPHSLQNLSKHLPGVWSDQKPHRNGSQGDYTPDSENFYTVGGTSRKVMMNHSSEGSQPGNCYHVGLNYHWALALTEVCPWTNHRCLQLGRSFVRIAVPKSLIL